jgi:hypothetical protein
MVLMRSQYYQTQNQIGGGRAPVKRAAANRAPQSQWHVNSASSRNTPDLHTGLARTSVQSDLVFPSM